MRGSSGLHLSASCKQLLSDSAASIPSSGQRILRGHGGYFRNEPSADRFVLPRPQPARQGFGIALM